MDISITILLLILSLLFKKSKVVTTLLFLFMWSLWGWNTWNGDYEGYNNFYTDSRFAITTNSYFEFGYHWLNHLLYSLGLSFQEYLICVSFFVLAIIFYFTLKYAKYPALYGGIYFFVFIMEFVFIRNYIVDALLLLAFGLIFQNIKRAKLWFLFILLICMTIHSTAIVLLIFIYPVFRRKTINISKALLFFLVLMICSALLFDKLLPFLGRNYLDKLDYYSSDSYILISILHLAMVIITYFFYSQVLKNTALGETWSRIYTIVINVNTVSLFYLSLYYHVPYFSRILKFLITFNLIFLFSAFYFKNPPPLRRKLMALAFSFVILFCAFFSKTNFPYTLYPLYKCNLIWGDELYVPVIPVE